MPTYYMATSTERSVLETNAPTSSAIRAALLTVQVPGGSWVGPSPRITRRFETGALRANLTTFAWPFAVPAPLDAAGLAAAQQAFATSLGQQSSDWDSVIITPFSPAVNGSLDDWNSGQLSVTQTTDQFPELGGRLAPNENPVGPNVPGVTTLPTVGQGINTQVQQATGGLSVSTLLWVGAGGLALYLAWPLIMEARASGYGRAARRQKRSAR